ncbi:MAG: cadherin domain-containing protein [Pseudomonadota bacterium]
MSLGLGTVSLASFLSTQVQAQTQSADQVSVSDIDGVANIQQLSNGALQVTLENGQIIQIPAGDFALVGGEFLMNVSVAEAFFGVSAVASASTAFGGGLVTAGLAAAGLGGAAIVAVSDESSGGGDVTVSNTAPTLSVSSGSASVQENSTSIPVTISATDPDAGQTLTYSLSGPDAAAFSIDSTTGELSFASAPDFEAPTDASSDNTYNVTVSVSDGTASVSEDLVITVGNENDNDPIFAAASATGSVEEGQTATDFTAIATDADGDTVTYSISGGADAALFVIDAATGAVSLIAAADADAPNDADGDGVYDLEVTASDGLNSTTQSVAITLTDVDEAPVFTGATSATVDENVAQIGAFTTASDPEGGAVTYSLGTSGDSALFTVNSTTGQLSFFAIPDFEAPTDGNGDNIYSVELIATDSSGNATAQGLQVTVDDANESPSIVSAATVSLDEGETAVLSVNAIDPDAADTLSYTIVGGPDAALFSIDANTGELTFIAAPDFEAPSDANSDNVFDVTVRVTDSGGLTNDQDIRVTLNDINDQAPVFVSGLTASVSEGQVATGYTASATDADAGSSVSYAIGAGGDGALFTIDPNTGELSFSNAPDFESPGDVDTDNVYQVNIEASDGTNIATQTVSVTVTDIPNEAAPSISINGTPTFDENSAAGTQVFTITAQDGDPSNGGFTYAITGGADAGLFSIDANTGAVTINTPQDFEAPGDSGADGVYDIEISVTDQPSSGSSRTTSQVVQVTLTDLDDLAPVFISATSATVAENQSATGYSFTANNTDGAQSSVTYAITGGADAGVFTIDTATGAVSFDPANPLPDFETPGSADGDNDYEVEVTATDGSGLTATQTTIISVTDVNDNAPAFTSGTTASVDENETSVAYVPAATDADATSTVTFSIGTAGDSALFQLNSTTGALEFITPPDFEAPTDADTDNDYEVELIADDGVNQTTQNVTITVNDRINESAPVISSANAGTVDENSTATILQVTATDADLGNGGFTFAITGGADSALFAIDTNGNLSFLAGQDADANPPSDADGDGTYEVIVEVTDQPDLVQFPGALPRSTTQTITVTLNDLDDVAPEFTSATATASVDENAAISDVIFTASATNTDGSAAVVYSLSGADAADFTIDAATGEIRFVASPDFEAPDDANTDNVYEISVDATDGSGLTSSQTLTITVNDLDDTAPAFTSATTANVDEGDTTGFYTAVAVDPDTVPANATITYSITGGADQAALSIDPSTGVLSLNTAPDFENPTDAGADNTYEVEITATDDAGNASFQTVVVTVNDLINEAAPVITSGATANIDENSTATITQVTATDADPGNGGFSFQILTGANDGADGGLFTIDGSGNLSFTAGADFEGGSADGDDVYEVTVEVTDQPAAGASRTTTQTLSITVDDVDDLAPVFVTPAPSGSTAEGTFATGVTVLANNTDGDQSSVTYAVVSGGADSGAFVIDATTGVLSFDSGNNAPDFENPADSDNDNIYEVNIRATDASGNSTTQLINVSVTDVNDQAPVFSGNTIGFIAENSITGSLASGAIIQANATDPETGATVAYSLGTSKDEQFFIIDSATGEVSLNTTALPNGFDAENGQGSGAVGTTGNAYIIDVIADDGSGTTATQQYTISAEDLNDNAPVFTSGAALSVAENTGGTVYTAVTTDADVGANNRAVTYSLSGTDAGDFTIDSTTGEVSFSGNPDFESPVDDDGDNVYEITVTATNTGGGGVTLTETQNVTITVTDVDPEGPNAELIDGVIGYRILGDVNNPGTFGGRDQGQFAGIGDVNGDGFADFLGSNFGTGFIGTSAGAASAPGAVQADGIFGTSITDGPVGFQAANAFLNAVTGFDVASIGDFNGDGLEDFMITEIGTGGGYIITDAAAAFSTGGTINLSQLAVNGLGFQLNLPVQYGTEISSIGDYNGDGFDDFLVLRGTTTDDPILVFGQAGTAAVAAATITLNGGFNTEAVGLGDVNGDGFADFAISSISGPSVGSVYVILGDGTNHGASTTTAGSITLNGSGADYNGFRIDGFGGFVASNFGESIAALGDVNGDRIDDFAIAAPTAETSGGGSTGPGMAFIFYGDLGFQTNQSAIVATDADVMFAGDAGTNLRFGSAIEGIGDVNGDGYADIGIGDPAADGTGGNLNEGRFYVIYGSDSLPDTSGGNLTNAISASQIGGQIDGFVAQGYSVALSGTTQAGIQYGSSLEALGDVNGDGIDDFAVGAEGQFIDNGAGAFTQTGAVYVIYGEAAAQTPAAVADLFGDQNYVLTSQDDLIIMQNGNDYVSAGGGDDLITTTELINNFGSQPQDINGRYDGGAGTDTFQVQDSASIANFGSQSYTFSGNTATPTTINFSNIERLDIAFSGATSSNGAAIVDISTVTSTLGENINGVRTLVVNFSTSDARLVIADSADWVDDGQTTFEGTLYNVFTHTTGAQIYAEAGGLNRVADLNGVGLKNPNTQSKVSLNFPDADTGADSAIQNDAPAETPDWAQMPDINNDRGFLDDGLFNQIGEVDMAIFAQGDTGASFFRADTAPMSLTEEAFDPLGDDFVALKEEVLVLEEQFEATSALSAASGPVVANVQAAGMSPIYTALPAQVSLERSDGLEPVDLWSESVVEDSTQDFV